MRYTLKITSNRFHSAKAVKIDMSMAKAEKEPELSMAKADKEPAISVEAKAEKEPVMSVEAKTVKE